jgi:hypothetical protein
MSTNKTAATNQDVKAFIHSFASEKQYADSFRLIEIMKDVSGEEPKMWGPTIVGFGNYHYKYDSGHQGDAPLIGFSPRKAAISLYVYSGHPEHESMLKNLGKFKMGKACIYIQKLSDIHEDVLKVLMKETIGFLKNKYKS